MIDLMAVLCILAGCAVAACVYCLVITWRNQVNIRYLVDKMNETMYRVRDLEVVVQEWEQIRG